jgi:hypothetical protein
MLEHEIQQRILLAIGSLPGLRVWRNNSGALIDERGKLVRFGLQGSADILGIIAPSGRFLGIEVKSATGRQTPQQKNFQSMVESMGGVYILARSVEEAMVCLKTIMG